MQPSIDYEDLARQSAEFLSVPAKRANPQALFRSLREHDPVHRSATGMWMLMSYSACLAAFKDPRFSREAQAAVEFEALGRSNADPVAARALEASKGMVVNLEGSDHRRVRRLIMHAFTPRSVAAWEGQVREIVNALFARIEQRDEFDFIAEIALPLPQAVMCQLVGVPLEDHKLWTGWAERQVAFNRADPDGGVGANDARTAITEFYSYFQDLIAKRRHSPGEDLASVLIQAREEEDRLSEQELIGTLMMLAVAGFETTANLIGNGMNALLDSPEQYEKLRANPSLASSAVEEFLRYESPSRMVMPKRTTDAVLVDGVEIPAGNSVLIVLASGNRDSAIFDEPDRLDIARANNPHLGLGTGPHVCLGAGFARLEARMIFDALARQPRILKRRDEETQWRETFVRGLKHLWVKQ